MKCRYQERTHCNMALMKWAQKHRYLALVLILQVTIIIILLANCFGDTFSVDISADDFYTGEGYIESSDDGNGIGVRSTENGGATYDILLTDYFDLKPGAYDITVNYQAERDESLAGEDQTYTIGSVYLDSQQSLLARHHDVRLLDNATSNSCRMWIPFPFTLSQSEFIVRYYAMGNLFINSMTIQELPIWRVSRLLIWLSLFLLIDILYWRFRLHEDGNKSRMVWLCGLLTVGFSSLLLANDLLLKGDDIFFHVERIIFLSDSLFGGQFPVRMMFGKLNGYGYPSSLFYGDLFLYLPSILYRMAFPVEVCYELYLLGVNTITYMVAYLCFKRISNSRTIGTIGASIYTLAYYRLICVFERAAIGECTAMVFTPLIILGLWNLYTQKDDGRFGILLYGPLVLGLTGLIQTHILSVFMWGEFIILFCLITLPKTLKLRRFLALVKALGWTAVLNLWFLLPFFDSMSMPILMNITAPATLIQNRGLNLSWLLSGISVGYIDPNNEGSVTYTIGLALMVAMVTYLIISNKRKTWSLSSSIDYRTAGISFGFSFLALWMSSNLFPWNAFTVLFSPAVASMLCSVQFPWRYLGLATLFATVTTVMVLSVLWQRNKRVFVYGAGSVMILLSLVVAGFMYVYLPIETYQVTYDNEQKIEGSINVSGGEYLLEGTDRLNIDPTPRAISQYITIENYEIDGNVKRMTISNTGEEDGRVQFPAFNYDNYHVFDTQTGVEYAIETGANNTVVAIVPGQYRGTLELRYVSPVSWRISEIVTLLAAAIYIWAAIKAKRQKAQSMGVYGSQPLIKR